MRIESVSLVTTDKGLGFIEIPIEKIIDGEVVTVDTKALPIIPIPPMKE
jgi:hypothetical protein